MFSGYFSLIFGERQGVYIESKVLWMKDYDNDYHGFVMGYWTGILNMVLIYHYHLLYYNYHNPSYCSELCWLFTKAALPAVKGGSLTMQCNLSLGQNIMVAFKSPTSSASSPSSKLSSCFIIKLSSSIIRFMILKANVCVYPLENIARIAKAARGVDGGGGESIWL